MNSDNSLIKDQIDFYNNQVAKVIKVSLDNVLGEGQWNEKEMQERCRIVTQHKADLAHLSLDGRVIASWPTPEGLAKGIDEISIPTKFERS